jgi:hypothetical protein
MAIATATQHDLMQVNGSRGRLELHAGQTKAWRSDARFTFIIAGSQSGKTSFGPWWTQRKIQQRGAGDYLAVTATYDLFKLKMLPEMRHVFCDLIQGWEWVASDRLLYRPSDKSRIILRSSNAPEGLESATAKAAWLDECGQDAFRLESWEAVQRRLALNQGDVLGTTTPYNLGWLKTQVYDRWTKGDPDYRVIQFKSIQNPSFPRAEYERAKRTLPAWKFAMFYDGQFSRPAGLIYSDFDENIHLVNRFDIPPEWPRYVGIDPGAVHTALIWLARDPDKNVFYVYRESLEGERTTAQHAQEARDLAKNENVVAWALGSRSEEQQRWDWRAAEIAAREPVIVDVEAGIDRVISLFKTGRLFVFRDLVGLRDELGTYSRKLDDAGQPTEAIKDKETFHRLDALRYAVQQIGLPVGEDMIGWA